VLYKYRANGKHLSVFNLGVFVFKEIIMKGKLKDLKKNPKQKQLFINTIIIKLSN
jgi:bifunctional N-acetylglucosamine-1-phosphate-uridyltransferase/glucosamine-1-phosphate-acetyltransferase GlmU-like protein